MKLRYEKSIRVLTDILGYCHLIGADDFHIDFSLQSHFTVISIEAAVPSAHPAEIARLEQLLNMPRQVEVEQYYWNISGEEEIDDELSLAGMMIDHAIVDYTDGILKIRAERIERSAEE